MPSAPALSITDLTDAEFSALLELDRPALELVHRLDFSGRCPACEAVAVLRYDYEYVVADEHDVLGSAVAHTCQGCHSTTSRGFLARPDLTDADLLRVLDRRAV